MSATTREELQDEFLSTLRKGQDIALDAMKTLVEAIEFVIPTMPEYRVPIVRRLPTPHEVVAHGNEFAEKLLANQREFALNLLSLCLPTNSVPRAATSSKRP